MIRTENELESLATQSSILVSLGQRMNDHQMNDTYPTRTCLERVMDYSV